LELVTKMTEKKTTLKVPEAYLPLLEDVRLLKSDENNPLWTCKPRKRQHKNKH
jgi:hypothetical protein